MLRFIKSFFKKTDEPTNSTPYKVETPAVTPVMVPPATEPAKCGCGRSATGFCVGLHKLTAEQWAAHPDNPVKPVSESAPVKPEAAKKKPAAKKAPVAKKEPVSKKPAAIKAAPKPRAKKAAK